MTDIPIIGAIFKMLPFLLAMVVLLHTLFSAYRRARRDYFAATWLSTFKLADGHGLTAEEVARRCYAVADAMEKVR